MLAVILYLVMAQCGVSRLTNDLGASEAICCLVLHAPVRLINVHPPLLGTLVV
jgi:hypothetical protein